MSAILHVKLRMCRMNQNGRLYNGNCSKITNPPILNSPPIIIGGGRVGPGRAMPDQEYGPEIINDVILSLILITIN